LFVFKAAKVVMLLLKGRFLLKMRILLSKIGDIRLRKMLKLTLLHPKFIFFEFPLHLFGEVVNEGVKPIFFDDLFVSFFFNVLKKVKNTSR
jgi:hypothetical protein